MSPSEPINMKAVLRQTGLKADTLRAWERRYGAVTPQRSASGRRVYSPAEVRRLQLLSELVRQGHSIGRLAGLKDEKLVTLLSRAGNRAPGPEPEDVKTGVEAVIEAIDTFDQAGARSALSRLRFTTSPRELAYVVLPRIMHVIGKRIEEGRMSISQEHALSDLVHSQLRQIYEDLAPLESAPSSRTLIFCTREGDPHDLGLLTAAVACRYRGYRTHYLGRSLPAESLAEAARKLKPIAVVLGISALPADEDRVTPAEYLKSVDALLPRTTEIWAGGSAVASLRRPKTQRDIWLFEGISDLERKLSKA